MKKLYLLLIFCLFLRVVIAQNPQVIWSEDFSAYNGVFDFSNNISGFGIEGSSSGVVNIGGYDPNTFTKWQLDNNGAALVNFSDYTAVFWSAAYPNNHLRAQDTDTGVDWITENIDVSGYNQVAVSMFIAEVGDHEASSVNGGDWVDVFYSFDNGASYTRLPNWNNLGDAAHTITGDTVHGVGCDADSDFGSTRVYFSIPDTENNLRLKVTLKNGASSENLILDDVLVTGIDNSLSVADVDAKNQFIIYPNPSSSVVNFKSENIIKSIRIYDVNQRLIKQQQNILAKTHTMNISGLQAGIYFVETLGEKSSRNTHKLIIK